MANRVGNQITRATAGPISAGPDPGDLLFVAVLAERGPVNVPTLITSMPNFRTVFGGATPIGAEARASSGYMNLRDFFQGGGRRAVVLRVVGAGAVAGSVDLQDRAGAPLDTLRITAKGEGAWANDYDVVIADGTKANTFKITLLDADGEIVNGEEWDNLTISSASITFVNAGSAYLILEDLASGTAAPDNRPAAGTFGLGSTVAGVDDNAPVAADIVGTEVDGVKTGLKAFKTREFRRGIYIAPDLDTDQTVIDELEGHLETYFRMHWSSTAEGTNVAGARARRLLFSSYAHRLIYPRAVDVDPFTGEIVTYPYLGRAVAQYFAVIEAKGPAKAAAGKDFYVKGVRGIETQSTGQPLIDSGVAEDLVGRGISPIWDRNGKGPAIWGGRSASDEANWSYVHQAYLWNRIADKIDVVIDEFVYEVVDESFDEDFFYRQVRQSIRGVLEAEWDLGAFSGQVPNDGDEESPEEHAFYVRCDAGLLSAADKQNGILRYEMWFKDALTGETIKGTIAKRTQT